MASSWWAKVLFKEFIRHFRKMTDEQIVLDIRKSMDDLDDLVDDADTFGSKMVRWSKERKELYPMAIENGKKGGRPRKAQASQALPSLDVLYDFAAAEGLDVFDARDWFEMTVKDRDGKDRRGNPIENWQGACKRFCESRAKKRNENDK